MDVKYLPGRDNGVLRQALWQVQSYRCYWCSAVKDFEDVTIDHLFPQSGSSAELASWRLSCGLSDAIDVHDLENLACICARCNLKKGANGHTLGVVQSQSRIAQSRVTEVRKVHAALLDPRTALPALNNALTMTLRTEDDMTAFVESVKRLASRAASVSAGPIYGNYVESVAILSPDGSDDLRLELRHSLDTDLALKAVSFGLGTSEPKDVIALQLRKQVCESAHTHLTEAHWTAITEFNQLNHDAIRDIEDQWIEDIGLQIEDIQLLNTVGVSPSVLQVDGSASISGASHGVRTFGPDGDHEPWQTTVSVDFDFIALVVISSSDHDLQCEELNVTSEIHSFAAMDQVS